MTEAEFRAYLERTMPEYADEHVRAGNWHPSEALQKSQEAFDQLLPEGLASAKQFLYTIVAADTDTPVGTLWFGVFDERVRPLAFLWDFIIFPEFRRQGYATQALGALEEKVRALGIDYIGLHVFAHNVGARSLYLKMGYEETDINMAKTLPRPGDEP
jgi:RimJ/RimL family protein N-acetyltransferase